jgi:hypothetical protein
VTRTVPLHLVLLAGLGAGSAWFLHVALTATGRAILIPPVTLAVALTLIGVIVIAMALPVRKVSRGVPNARIDPFYATRVVILAKASSLGGALLAGAGLATGAYLLSRSVVPTTASVTLAFATAVGAIVLLVAGLVAEHMCALPPDDDSPDAKRDVRGTP